MNDCERNCPCALRLDRIEAALKEIASPKMTKPKPTPRRLVKAIYDATNGECFLSGDLWQMAGAERVTAAATGEEEPELSKALRDERLNSVHGLSRWIAREDWAFERGGSERGSVLWQVIVSAVNETTETA